MDVFTIGYCMLAEMRTYKEEEKSLNFHMRFTWMLLPVRLKLFKSLP